MSCPFIQNKGGNAALTSGAFRRNNTFTQTHNSRNVLQGYLVIAVAVLVTRVAVHSTKVRVYDGLFCRNAASGVIDKEQIE